MSFGSNTQPPKFGKGAPKKQALARWVCGCGLSLPRFVLFCKKCERGQ